MHTWRFAAVDLFIYLEDPADLEPLVGERGQGLAARRLGEGGIVLLGPGLLYMQYARCIRLGFRSHNRLGPAGWLTG